MKQPTSPLPWKIDPAEDLPLAIIQDTEDGLGVAEGDVGRDEFQIQDFEYIVEACNNYPTAIRYIERLLEFLYGITDNEYLYSPKFGSTPLKEIEKFLKSID